MNSLVEMRDLGAKHLVYGLLAHIPVLLAIGLFLEAENTVFTTVTAILVAAFPAFLHFTNKKGELLRYTASAGIVLMAGLLVYVFRGHPWQIDAHMYFFAALASTLLVCDWRAVIVAAGVTAVHHLVLNFTLPAWVFPGDADFLRVLFHATVVILETVVLVIVTLRLAETIASASEATKIAEEAAMTAAGEAMAAADAKEEAEQALSRAQELEQESQLAEKAKLQALEKSRQDAEDARAVLAGEFESSLQGTIGNITKVGDTLAEEVDTLQNIADEAESTIQVASSATDNVSSNVSSVASSAEQMSASVSEIAQQVTKSAAVVDKAREHAGESERYINQLAERADKINNVLTMIGDIAEQTNLLALNATIEAARAGDAGKGFAVVASEVKSLANQSANATGEIGQLLAGIREATKDAVSANQTIVQVIGEIGENSNNIAAAVEEQSAATAEIARSAQTAAGETIEANRSVQNLRVIAGKVGELSGKTSEVVGTLLEQSTGLSSNAGEFVHRIRSA